jgi:hypothetical protein
MAQLYPDGPPCGYVNEIPMRRFGSPDDVGAVATFLASERASYVTGTTINVAGGLSRTIFEEVVINYIPAMGADEGNNRGTVGTFGRSVIGVGPFGHRLQQ